MVKGVSRAFSELRKSSWREIIQNISLFRRPASSEQTEPLTRSSGPLSAKHEMQIDFSLPDIMQWARSSEIHKKEWLILGKGPSYQFIENVNLNDFYTCSLNHVVREHPVDLAHIIDIDVVEDCRESIEKNARFLVLPYFPHVQHNPTSKSIHDFVKEMPVLQSLKEQGRLIWYNLSSSKKQIGSSPVIVAKFFSAEAAVNILSACGVTRIRSLGVDGGNTYAAAYDDLKTKTLLANTHSSFDRQFEQIAKTIRSRGIFYAPLHKQAPIQIFVGTDKSQMLAAKVLEYSIKKHASMSVNFVRMCDIPVPLPKDPQNHPRTGFSFCRFLIPSLCDYKGRAIYVDADMLVFNDISKLWDLPMDGADILCAEQAADKGRVRQYSVILMDCANLPWKIDQIVKGLDDEKYNYAKLMYEFCVVAPEKIAPTVPYEWNSLEFYEPGKTCLVHYTDMPKQPWVSYENKNGSVWYQTLKEGIQEGFITKEELYHEVELGHVLSDLPQYIGLGAHKDFKRLASNFIAPYKRLIKR
jgi:hypothetical protein